MKFKLAASVLLTLMLCTLIFSAPAQAEYAVLHNPQMTAADIGKNETVYAKLGFDGTAGDIYVVNQLLGSYIDYGNYQSIKNLSTMSEPVIEGDMITFADEKVDGGLYYQGTTTGELPMKFSIQYAMNGTPVDATSLAGARGHIRIDIGCAQNERCDARVREGLMAQIVVNLDMGLAQNIKADGATTVIAGNSMNIAFVVLPREAGAFSIEADVTDFKMDAISITLTQGGLGGYKDSIDGYEDDFNDMLSGANDLVDGTSDLKDGVRSLASGLGDLNNGLDKLKTAGGEMIDGMRQYGAGLQQYAQGVNRMATASGDVLAGLNTLADNGAALSGKLSAFSGNVDAMASNAELRALAESLASSSDPSVQALANGTLAMINGMGGVSEGFSELSGGVSAYTAGVGQAAVQYGGFNAGLSQIAAGGDSLISGYTGIAEGAGTYAAGVGSSAEGASRIYKAVKGLPNHIQELIDGQAEFRDGISTAHEQLLDQTSGLSASNPVSFTSPDKNHPLSVQYILMTPAIEKPAAKVNTDESQKADTFFTRLADLFS